MKKMKTIKSFIVNNLHIWIVLAVGLLCTLFLVFGTPNEEGYITVGGDVTIEDSTKKFIEDSQAALYRIMNEDAPTDEGTIREWAILNGEGKGGSTTLEQVLSRRLEDGNNDNGAGWQCSRYTGWLATGQWSYSTVHPDYGPVNGKNMAQWLVDNFGWKYTDTPVEGAIGSGGFNTLYGHTAMFLYWVSDGVAMVNDANYVPLTVATHPMNVDGWVWVVPGDYTPDPEPTPAPEPSPSPVPVAKCDRWTLVWGDTLGKIMKTCEGRAIWGETMNDYAKTWVDEATGMTVWEGWNAYPGVGLKAGHTIKHLGD